MTNGFKHIRLCLFLEQSLIFFYRSHDSFHVHMRNQICTEWAWGNRSWCSFTKFDTQKYTFPSLVGGTLNHGKLQWKSLRWRLGKSIRRKLLWPKDLPLSWLTNSSGFLRSSDQARLKISLVYFQDPSVASHTSNAARGLEDFNPFAEQNTSQASGAAKVLHIFVFISRL